MKTILSIASSAEVACVDSVRLGVDSHSAQCIFVSSDALALNSLLSTAVGIITRSPLDACQIALAEKCLVIAHAGAGAGGIDLEAARARGIYITSVPDFATAEYCGLAIFALNQFAESARACGSFPD